VDYAEFDWRKPVALVVGGEAAGAGERIRSSIERTVSIPMAAGVESLNVAAATAVLLFEAARQRRIST
jgi:TrmH family RNA methyltransferase